MFVTIYHSQLSITGQQLDTNYNNVVCSTDMEWKSLLRKLLEFDKPYVDKRKAPMVSGWKFEPFDPTEPKKKNATEFWTGNRNKDYAISSDYLILDYDNGDTIKEAVEKFKEYEFFLYTSYNHRIGKREGYDAFRMVFPLARSVNVAEWEARRSVLQALVDGADLSSVDVARGFVAPCYPPDDTIRVRKWNRGELFDVLGLRVPVVVPRKVLRVMPERPVENDKVLDLIMTLDLSGYYDKAWRRLIMAMVALGFNESDAVDVACACKPSEVNTVPALWKATEQKFSLEVVEGKKILYNLIREFGSTTDYEDLKKLL